MQNWINREGVINIWKTYFYTILLFILFVLYFIYFIYTSSIEPSPIINGDLSILIGLFSLFIAEYSIQTSTKQLRDIQTDYWNTRAIDQREKKNYHDALQAHDKSIKIDPMSTKCWINKANTLSERGDHNKEDLIKALECINEAVDLGPKCPATWKKWTYEEWKAIQEHANSWNTKGAIEMHLANALEKTTSIAYICSDLRMQAYKSFEKSIELHKSQYEEFQKNSRSYLDEHPLALLIYNRFSKVRNYELNPEIVGSLANKGLLLSAIGSYSNAITAIDNAIQIDRYQSLAWHLKGDILRKKGSFLEAEKKIIDANSAYNDALFAYDTAISLDPKNSMVWQNKGYTLKLKNNYTTAITAFNKAIEFDRQNLDAWNNKGRTLFGAGYFLKAIECYNRALEVNPHDPQVLLNKYEALYKLKNQYINGNDYKNAFLLHYSSIGVLRKLVEINPQDEVLWFKMGDAFYCLKGYGEAANAYGNSIEINPRFFEAWVNKGNAHFNLGEYSKALDCFNAAFRIDPNNTILNQNRYAALVSANKDSD